MRNRLRARHAALLRYIPCLAWDHAVQGVLALPGAPKGPVAANRTPVSRRAGAESAVN